MSCPRCEPSTRSRRWLWWAALAALVTAGAWLERSGGAPSSATSPGTPPSATPPSATSRGAP